MFEEQLEGFDFSNLRLRRKNMLDACGTIDYDSYTLQLRAIGDEIMDEVCTAAKYPRAPYLELQRLKDDPQTIVGFPRSQSGASTVSINWADKGETAHIDLSRLMAAQPFHIPSGSRAYIPVEQVNLPTLGPCIVFRFGSATFKPMEAAKNQSGSAKSEAAAATDQTKA